MRTLALMNYVTYASMTALLTTVVACNDMTLTAFDQGHGRPTSGGVYVHSVTVERVPFTAVGSRGYVSTTFACRSDVQAPGCTTSGFVGARSLRAWCDDDACRASLGSGEDLSIQAGADVDVFPLRAGPTRLHVSVIGANDEEWTAETELRFHEASRIELERDVFDARPTLSMLPGVEHHWSVAAYSEELDAPGRIYFTGEGIRMRVEGQGIEPLPGPPPGSTLWYGGELSTMVRAVTPGTASILVSVGRVEAARTLRVASPDDVVALELREATLVSEWNFVDAPLTALSMVIDDPGAHATIAAAVAKLRDGALAVAVPMCVMEPADVAAITLGQGSFWVRLDALKAGSATLVCRLGNVETRALVSVSDSR